MQKEVRKITNVLFYPVLIVSYTQNISKAADADECALRNVCCGKSTLIDIFSLIYIFNYMPLDFVFSLQCRYVYIFCPQASSRTANDTPVFSSP